MIKIKEYPQKFKTENIEYELVKIYKRYATYKSLKAGYVTTFTLENINFPKEVTENGRNTDSGKQYIKLDRNRLKYYVRFNKKKYGVYDTIDEAIVRRDEVLKELGVEL